MDEEIVERLDAIEKKLDEILLRLPLPTYTTTYPSTLPIYTPEKGSTAVEHGD